MNYGFVINNSSCIGCHACSTACKSENEVPLGVYRTWVKYTEVGTFPDARRNFQVTRCNHCANPPCVRICPVSAMVQRDDGIVDFDSDACIGCKGCMQACPYDAIHLDPESKTAAKCNFCSHRMDVGLEPACVIVCPEHAIIAGDLDDPESEITRVLAKHNVVVRKPEQGTSPKLFYIEGNQLALHPTAAVRPDQMMWADVRHEAHHDPLGLGTAAPNPKQGKRTNEHGTRIRTPGEQGLPTAGPLNVGGTMAEHMVQVAYNAQHETHWHWQIPAYIVTKHIAGGIFFWLALTALTNIAPFSLGAMMGGGALAIAMTLVTLALLLYDLDRPDRFFYLLIRPQWRSWIARAAWILSGFSGVTTLWWLVEAAGGMGWIGMGFVESVRTPLALLTIPFATMASIYTAFLFAQAEGRDLWQGPHLPAQMAVHGLMLGAGSIAALGAIVTLPAQLVGFATSVFTWTLVASLLGTITSDLAIPQATELARTAAHDITRGRYRDYFWRGGLGLGHVVPLLLLATGQSLLTPFALVAAASGLFLYSYAFVMAPQNIPNS